MIALTQADSGWAPLAGVLKRSGTVTAILMLGVALLAGTIGTATAWLVATFDFPGRRLAASALVLPLAVPTYISAYCFIEFLHFTGPVQEAIRDLFGFRTSRDYWFPDIRSLPGAIVILSLALYPYVFLTVRTQLAVQGPAAREAAAILGASRLQALRRVLLPLARPAVATGLALVLMETLNDIGAVEALGVPTITFAVFSTWLNGNDLGGATRIAILLLAVVACLAYGERLTRRRLRLASEISERQGSFLVPLEGALGWAALLACLAPVAGGFAIPLAVLLHDAGRRLPGLLDPALWQAAGYTVLVATGAGLACAFGGLAVAFALRLADAPALRLLARLGAVGYAIPGTVLAIGILIPLAAFDNALDGLLREHVGFSTGLLLSGSSAVLVYASAVRFNAMGLGTLESGFAALSPSIDLSARGFGCSAGRMLREIFLPLLRPSLVTAFLLVFVESAKELSATILLRPFGVETLATFVYAQASRAAFEEGAGAALLIVAIGILPVVLLRRLGETGVRPAEKPRTFVSRSAAQVLFLRFGNP